MIEAPDLRKMFVADAEDSILFDINVDTMKIEGQVQLPANDSPDGVGYDPVDHRVFVSDPGTPIDITKSGNVERKNQNVSVVDAIHCRLRSAAAAARSESTSTVPPFATPRY